MKLSNEKFEIVHKGNPHLAALVAATLSPRGRVELEIFPAESHGCLLLIRWHFELHAHGAPLYNIVGKAIYNLTFESDNSDAFNALDNYLLNIQKQMTNAFLLETKDTGLYGNEIMLPESNRKQYVEDIINYAKTQNWL